MEIIVTTSLLVLIVFLAILNFFTHNSRVGKLVDKIPGPYFWPIIGNTLDFVTNSEKQWKLLRGWANDYYPTYKCWVCHIPVICLRHPDDAEILLVSQQNISKSFLYDFLHPWLNEGLLTSNGDKWRRRRKTLTPAFHFNVLQEFVGVFVENSKRMVDELKQDNGEVVKDVTPFLAKYTLNAICETAMGTTLKDNDSLQEEYRRSVKRIGDIVYYRAAQPWLISDWIFSLTPKAREQKEALNILHSFTSKIIKTRQTYHEKTGGKYLKSFSSENDSIDESNLPTYEIPMKKKRLAMLDLLIADQKLRDNIDDLGIREEVDTFVFEGHDTTLIAMSFALALLAEHKDIQALARAEIDEVLKESNGELRINELNNLSYLDRCIKESLRMFPSVPLISRKITADMQLKDFLIPRGSSVVLHIFDIHRDPNFWPQPDVYDPDRFLPDQIEGRHPFSYIPFSGGPRNCIGQKFAMFELKVIIGTLLHNFYLETTVKVGEVSLLPDLVLKSGTPLNVKFIPIR